MHVYRNSGGQAGTTARFVEAAYNVVANAGDRALLAAKESTFFFFFKHASRGNNSWKKIKARTCIRWPTRMFKDERNFTFEIFPAAHILSLSPPRWVTNRNASGEVDVRLRFMIFICFSHYKCSSYSWATEELNLSLRYDHRRRKSKCSYIWLLSRILLTCSSRDHEFPSHSNLSIAGTFFSSFLEKLPSLSKNSFRLCRAIIGNLWCGSKRHALIVKSELASS